jgi:hypothetical protein
MAKEIVYRILSLEHTIKSSREGILVEIVNTRSGEIKTAFFSEYHNPEWIQIAEQQGIGEHLAISWKPLEAPDGNTYYVPDTVRKAEDPDDPNVELKNISVHNERNIGEPSRTAEEAIRTVALEQSIRYLQILIPFLGQKITTDLLDEMLIKKTDMFTKLIKGEPDIKSGKAGGHTAPRIQGMNLPPLPSEDEYVLN